MRIFGIDPGSVRTGYGCVETDGSRHRLVTCGALAAPGARQLSANGSSSSTTASRGCSRPPRPIASSIENLFHARNVRSALVLGHARGVAVLAAVEAGLPVVEYTPAEIKLAVVGYGRAEKAQMQQMVKLLLGLDTVPTPHDAADALAIAICHAHIHRRAARWPRGRQPRHLRSWRHAKLPERARRPASVIAHLTGTLLEKQRPAARRRRRRRRLRRAGAALDVLRRRRAGDRRLAAHPHARARGRDSAVRVCHAARALALRAADRRQRHRTQSRAVGAVRHRAGAISSARSASRTSRGSRAFPASARRPPSAS